MSEITVADYTVWGLFYVAVFYTPIRAWLSARIHRTPTPKPEGG